jgi:LPS-assembly protein
VTDDYYFQDLGGGLANQAGFNQLVQQSTLQYHAEHWTFTGLVQNYQTLHPVNTAPFVDQFSRFPQLNLGTSYPDVFGHLDLGNQISYTNFRQPMITNHFDTNLPLRTVGQRLNVAPTLSVPNYAPWGYIAPRLQLDGTVYRLSDLEHNIPRDIHRGIPIFNIDTGLYFDRHTHLGTKDFTQTFEPRLFYLWAPTVPQGNIPLFDTAEPLFSYDMLFQTNRFNGIDRISNANQVGVGLTNRLINSATGNDLLTASIGQIYYFTDRKVYLTTGTRNDDQKISPIAGLLNYQITPALNITGNGAWNPTFHYFQNSALNLGYKRDPKHILNVGFTYQRYNALDPGFIPINRNNDIQQLATSGAWPISTKWSAIAALTYNLNNRYAQNYLTGLQYDTCCWALRIVSAHNFLFLNQQNTPIYDTSYYVEWVLKGLTNVSMNSPTSLLVNSVPGYTNTIENY